ncbi:hypothetical protein CC2G_008382 [Coprinopsis cinerea AmutBmut pab1-1]|nr:hypothetical protein CC2G_008382 [Coprinopsis cinerea AmutBmut pab1-1]
MKRKYRRRVPTFLDPAYRRQARSPLFTLTTTTTTLIAAAVDDDDDDRRHAGKCSAAWKSKSQKATGADLSPEFTRNLGSIPIPLSLVCYPAQNVALEMPMHPPEM